MLLRACGLFVLTALAEVIGCYLPYLWLREGRVAWLLLPAAVSLAVFAWLLTLHPTGARPHVCRLWRRVHRRGAHLAVTRGGREAQPLGTALVRSSP